MPGSDRGAAATALATLGRVHIDDGGASLVSVLSSERRAIDDARESVRMGPRRRAEREAPVAALEGGGRCAAEPRMADASSRAGQAHTSSPDDRPVVERGGRARVTARKGSSDRAVGRPSEAQRSTST